MKACNTKISSRTFSKSTSRQINYTQSSQSHTHKIDVKKNVLITMDNIYFQLVLKLVDYIQFDFDSSLLLLYS